MGSTIETYCLGLRRDLLPDIKQYSDYFTFQQDGAPAHRARETVELLKVETPDFIPPNLWPPNSPDLNPVDYKIWGVLQERVYKTSIKDVDELRRRIDEEWDKLEQRLIDKAVGEWQKRHRACVAAGGGQFEHKMRTFIISDFLYRNFQTQLFEILLFCPVKTGCFVEYNVCYVLHFVTAMLCYTKNIYKICNSKP